MRKIGLQILFLLMTGGVFCAELPLTEFLQRARHPQSGATYTAMTGTVTHLRRGGKPESAGVYFALIILPERMTGELLIGNDEGYLIGQSRMPGAGESTMVPMHKEKAESALARMGLRPSDLAMNFLFFNHPRELPEETVRLIPCRVVEMLSPDGGERVRVYLAKEHYFPLKAEFFKTGTKDAAPYRTLEVNSFARKNGLYYASELGIYGPGWRTRLNFDTPQVIGAYEPGKSVNIIRKLGEVR